jgi:hypothetical protein
MALSAALYLERIKSQYGRCCREVFVMLTREVPKSFSEYRAASIIRVSMNIATVSC